MSELTIAIAGESLRLLPERAVYWEREEMLIAADLHWGKAAAFRAGGIPIPGGTTTADLSRLDRAVARTGARRLALLGDLLHAREWRGAETVRAIAAWRAVARGLELLLIRGNHDRRAGDPPADLDIEVVDGPWRVGPFALRHEPTRVDGAYVLAGHVHPGVTIRGPGRERLRLPCFALGRSVGILPAFSEFTGTALIDPGPGGRVFVIAGEDVVEVDSLRLDRYG